MDFTFSTEAEDAAGLAAQILDGKVTPDRLKEVEAGGDRFDATLWAELGRSGLLSLAVPEAYGGAGLGLLELSRILVEVGRRVAPTTLAVHAPVALLIAEAGSDDQRSTWLPRAATGDVVLSAAIAEDLEQLPERPQVTAEEADGGWQLSGTKTLVRAATHAALLAVTTSTAAGTRVLLVPTDAAGVTVESQRTSDGDVVGLVSFDNTQVPADALLGDESTAARLTQLLTVASCAEVLGITEGGLKLTAAYATSREQFGRPIGTFQGVRHRLADGHIDVLGQRLTLWQAADAVGKGQPAAMEVATAKLWAADAAHRIAHTTVHVHGGVGIDLDGEAHRYFTAAKRFEFAFGGATQQALILGQALART